MRPLPYAARWRFEHKHYPNGLMPVVGWLGVRSSSLDGLWPRDLGTDFIDRRAMVLP